MKKKILLSLGITLVSLTFFYTTVYPYINGADPGYTGAPGDANCTFCHLGTPDNNSVAVNIKLLDNTTEVTEYEAGKTYKVNIELNDANANVAGFEASIKKGTQPAGSLSVTNSDVKLTAGNANYVTHKSVSLHHAGFDSWEFNWTAPSSDQGPLTIYTAVNAGNGDNQNSGDNIHLKSKAITFKQGSGINDETLFSQNINLWPNPVKNYLTVDMALSAPGIVTARLFSLDGKLLQTETGRFSPTGNYRHYLDMTACENGIYLLEVSDGTHTAAKKVMKNTN